VFGWGAYRNGTVASHVWLESTRMEQSLRANIHSRFRMPRSRKTGRPSCPTLTPSHAVRRRHLKRGGGEACALPKLERRGAGAREARGTTAG